MRKGDAHDGYQSIRDRTIITDHRRQSDSAHKKDQDKVKRRYLLAETPANNTDYKNQKAIAEDSSKNATHINAYFLDPAEQKFALGIFTRNLTGEIRVIETEQMSPNTQITTWVDSKDGQRTNH
jgi:hypothetical protein